MPAQRPQGWWYPWLFVAGMLVVVAVNGVLVAYAIGTFPGLSTEDAYRKGLAYNQTLAAARAQDERGWQAEVSFAARPGAGPHAGELLVRLADPGGAGLGGLAVTAVLMRPTHGGRDVSLALEDRGGGLYAIPVALPAAGQWDAWVRARRDPVDWQATRRILVP